MALTTPRQVGRLLRAARERAGLTQAALALRLRVSRKWVSEAEAGSPGTTIGPLLRALNAVGATLTAAEKQAPRDNVIVIPDVDAVLAATTHEPVEHQTKPPRSRSKRR